MTDPDILVVSERRLLVDALASVLSAHVKSKIDASPSLEALRQFVESDNGVTIIVDLESPGVSSLHLVDVIADHAGRRCGVYDRFTAGIAQLAFDLGIRAPVALESPVDVIVTTVTATLATSVTRAVGPTRHDLEQLASLSARELEVLQATARGQTAAHIAAHLGITRHTVETHRRRAFRKLGATTQAEVVGLLARAGGLVEIWP